MSVTVVMVLDVSEKNDSNDLVGDNVDHSTDDHGSEKNTSNPSCNSNNNNLAEAKQ